MLILTNTGIRIMKCEEICESDEEYSNDKDLKHVI